MEYSKETSGTSECYGLVYHPTDKTVTFCYRGTSNTVIQAEDLTDAQVSAVKAFASAFGASEGFGTKAAIEKDVTDVIAAKKAAKIEADKPVEPE